MMAVALIVSRDDAEYPWANRPDDHNEIGLFAIGPQEARPSVVRLMGDSKPPREAPLTPRNARQAAHTKQRMAKITLATHDRLKALNKLLQAINGR